MDYDPPRSSTVICKRRTIRREHGTVDPRV